ncbi:hypothetical protein DS6A_68 [Mycobacterium phage DS6A]|uniref:Uncharacterized protein n=1 Tax=Mycobacterium phage DS6A TaxID=45764 RepID=G8I4H8_9CAUD|nr:hypothetical protein DS6A_68 [Mycobacterium phage DS6A]AER47622.1 hypothetical protein DS6A_68 [Mycobacterium phage DS6A]
MTSHIEQARFAASLASAEDAADIGAVVQRGILHALLAIAEAVTPPVPRVDMSMHVPTRVPTLAELSRVGLEHVGVADDDEPLIDADGHHYDKGLC